MATFEPGKRIICAGMDLDIISRLPDEIKDRILIKLPIKEAVRTSILSTKWKYTWATISEIVIDDDELVPDVDGPVALSRLVRIVDLLLFLHKGPILKFDLSTQHLCAEALDRWILYLSRNGITKLTVLPYLPYHIVTQYTIPSNFFFCNALQNVHLSMCYIKLPSGFEGFKLLNTLKLDKCSIYAIDFEKLVSSSTELVVLSLHDLYIISGILHIHAKKLKWLKIVGAISDVQIDAPQLTTLLIESKLMYFPGQGKKPGSASNLYKTLGGLLKIKTLHITGTCILHLMGEVVEFPRAFSHLNELVLSANLADQKECNFVYLLVQRAINLKKLSLIVMSRNASRSSFWEDKSNLGFALEHLEEVSIMKFRTSEPILAFIKLVLGSASVLKKIILDEKGPKEENPLIFKQLLKFRRVSAEAEVIFN